MNCINNESHLPIPVRLADLETHKMRKKLIGGECCKTHKYPKMNA